MDKELLIQKYFENTLSVQEKETFETLLLSDVDFADDVAFQKRLKKVIASNERSRLKTKIKSFEENKKQKYTWWAAAASILLCVSIALWMFGQNPSNEKLYAVYFEPYPNTVDPIVRNDQDIITAKTKAFMAYESEDYKIASLLFAEILVDTNEEYASFYQAMSLMSLNQTEKALSILENTDWTTSFQAQSLWYLALCKLKLNQIEDCKSLLLILNEYSNGFNSEKLLSELK